MVLNAVTLLACLLFPPLCTEKLIEGLKSPDASLMLPDLLSMSDPFGSSVEDMRDGKMHTHTRASVLSLTLHRLSYV